MKFKKDLYNPTKHNKARDLIHKIDIEWTKEAKEKEPKFENALWRANRHLFFRLFTCQEKL